MYSAKNSAALKQRPGPALLAVLLAALIATTAGAGWHRGSRLPALAGLGLSGTVPPLEKKVVLIDFWASWCGPCKHSFPELDKLYKEYQDRGFCLVAVSVDEKAGAMKKFLDEHPVAFSTVHDADHRLVAEAEVASMPTSFLVDRQGVIRFVHVGFRGAADVKQLRQEIEQLLTEK
ncbi:MAG: TlpA disulfide reductase family protein [Kiritimatiellaeota bacterium]|nr:TlpA disulfide reductase family protein [Kiritimatiellota bacterium]